MGIGDTFRDSSHDLAHYIYDPFWNEGVDDPRLRTGLAVWAALRFVYPDPFIMPLDAAVQAAMDGDQERLDRIIAMGGEQSPAEQRRDYTAAATFIKAIEEHLVPLLPSVEWILEPYKEQATKGE
jgi:hypothetical protein